MYRFACVSLAASVAFAQEAETVLRKTDSLLRDGKYREAVAEVESALRPAPPTVTVMLLANLASAHAHLGNHQEAENIYLRALKSAQAFEPRRPPLEWSIRQNLLVMYVEAGWLAKADRAAAEALSDIHLAGPPQQIHFLDGVGNLCRLRRHFAEAESHFQSALAIAEGSSDRDAPGFLWNSIGLVRLENRKPANAVKAFERSIECHKSGGKINHPALIAVWTNLGAALLTAKQTARAEAALATARRLGWEFAPESGSLRTILLLEAAAFDKLKRRAEAEQARLQARGIKQGQQDAFTVDVERLRVK